MADDKNPPKPVHREESESPPDRLLPERFAVRPGEEQLNNDRWQPVGTLAMNVLVRPRVRYQIHFTRGGWGIGPAGTWINVEKHDLQRLRSISAWREPEQKQRDVAQLSQVRMQAEALPHLPVAKKRPKGFVKQFPKSVVPFMRNLTPTLLQWDGPSGQEDHFLTTRAGAVWLSTVYGVARGRLRACKDCGVFFVFPRRKGFERENCTDCDALRKGHARPGESPKLAYWKQERWAMVQDRVRKSGFKRWGYTPEGQKEWRQWARTLLNQVKNRHGLKDWEERVAPEGKAGKPPAKGNEPPIRPIGFDPSA